jgi:hypothetical protein
LAIPGEQSCLFRLRFRAKSGHREHR